MYLVKTSSVRQLAFIYSWLSIHIWHNVSPFFTAATTNTGVNSPVHFPSPFILSHSLISLTLVSAFLSFSVPSCPQLRSFPCRDHLDVPLTQLHSLPILLCCLLNYFFFLDAISNFLPDLDVARLKTFIYSTFSSPPSNNSATDASVSIVYRPFNPRLIFTSARFQIIKDLTLKWDGLEGWLIFPLRHASSVNYGASYAVTSRFLS